MPYKQGECARLTAVIDRCNRAIAREQKLTLTIMREEHTKYLVRLKAREAQRLAKAEATQT